MTAASAFVALAVLIALALFAALVGIALRPRCDAGGFDDVPATPPYAATRCGNESLKNFASPAPSGEKRGWRPTADVPARRRPHAFFRRAL